MTLYLFFAFVPLSSLLVAAYTIKDLQLRPASEYASHQSFQGISIGALPYTTDEKIQEIFDTDKLRQHDLLPVLIVIDNENEFPIGLSEDQIFLVDSANSQYAPIHFTDVLLEINLDKPLSAYSSRKEILLRKNVKKEMFLDFEHKSFQEKLIAPLSSDYGIVFFRVAQGSKLQGFRLYFPEVVNIVTEEPLMFFEFELKEPAA